MAGKDNPTVDDVKHVLEAAEGVVDESRISKVVKELNGKKIQVTVLSKA